MQFASASVPRDAIRTAASFLFLTIICLGQTDPGPRSGPAGAGSYYSTLDSTEQTFFQAALKNFLEVDSVSGKIAGETGSGLGPTFNGNSCAMCHAQPAVGGSSPGLNSPQNPIPNPQVALATLDGAVNTVPSFITASGPVREARFIVVSSNSGALDGGVHGLYTITGRSDAPGCTLAQPNFASELTSHNVIFRIPTPLFGLGLVESTPDATLQTNLSSTSSQRTPLGIGGRFNTSGNDGTVTRFGWKAQNKSLLIFAGEAYNVEQGVSNEAFPNERSMVTGCAFNPTPEDFTSMTSPNLSDVINFAAFIRLSAPPTATTQTSSQLNGQSLFTSIGCSLCHSTTLTAGTSNFTGMSSVTYHPYSDFALHHMGSGLADGINQGTAGPDEFRTAPLWGVGQRLFFLHDGRTTDLMQAIEDHTGPGTDCVTTETAEVFKANATVFTPVSLTFTCASEANGVIANFNALSSSQKQDLLNFLRSL